MRRSRRPYRNVSRPSGVPCVRGVRLQPDRGCRDLLALSVSGCTSSRETASLPDRPALRPVSLPDMTGAAESVQAQLRDRYASLKLKLDRAGTLRRRPGRRVRRDGQAVHRRGVSRRGGVVLRERAGARSRTTCGGPTTSATSTGSGTSRRKRRGSSRSRSTLEPDHVPTLVWLGEMRLAQNRPDEAERLFTRALAIQSRSTAALYGLGRAALARQQYAQAVTHLEAALALEPQARASTIRWRWPTADWAIAGTPTPTSACAATSRSLRPIRCWRRSPDC